MTETPSSDVAAAMRIACQDLRWCYRDKGIISGSRLVYWSWDSFFASFGALALGDHPVVKKNLGLYLSFQNREGAVPKRLAHPFYWVKYAGIPLKENFDRQEPTFWNSYFTATSITQNPTLVIAFDEYVSASGDREFLAAHFEQLEKVCAYLEKRENRLGLLNEGLGGGWAESVLKRGSIAFTNMCYARCLEGMERMARLNGEKERAAYYGKRSADVKENINRELWSDEDGGYYSDWLGHRRHHHFVTDGNLLAVWWGIAGADRGQKIMRKLKEMALDEDIPIRLAYADYDFWRIYIFNRIGGMQDYHVGFSWTWLGCVDVVAKQKLGDLPEARQVLERIAAVIVRDGTVHETYDNGKPAHTIFYKSEHPWAWGAGLFLYACSRLGYQLPD